MKTILLALLFLPAVGASAESRKVKLRTICFEHAGDLKNVVLVGGDRKTPGPELPLFTSAFSDEIEATIQGDELVFAGISADGSPLIPVASGKAVPGERQLVVFIPGARGANPYRLLVIDDSEKAFPMGATIAYNLSSSAVRFSVGEHASDLKPGAHWLIPQPKKVNAMNQAGVVISFADKSGKLVPVNSTRWLSTDQQRTLAIAYVHPETRQPTVNAYVDTPPWHLPKLD